VTLADCANLALVIAAVAATTSALLLFREVRENNKLARAKNTQALVELSSPFYPGLIHDRRMAEICLHGSKDFNELDDVDVYRYKNLLIWWLIFHENIYYQYRNGLLDLHSYRPRARDLRTFVEQQNLTFHWRSMRRLFQDEFSEHMEELLNDTPQPSGVQR
jgi:hypothetical protein